MTNSGKKTAGTLARKMKTPCLEGSTNVLKARDLMELHDVEVVGVSCKGNFVGTFCREDFRRTLKRQNLDPATTTLYEVMISDPPYILEDLTISEACEIMSQSELEHMAVLSGKTLCGIISLNDLNIVLGLLEDCKNAIFEKDMAISYLHGGESYAIANYSEQTMKKV